MEFVLSRRRDTTRYDMKVLSGKEITVSKLWVVTTVDQVTWSEIHKLSHLASTLGTEHPLIWLGMFGLLSLVRFASNETAQTKMVC